MISKAIGRLARLAALAASMVIFLGAEAALAETIVVKTITYFNVGGTTAAEIDRNMAKAGPLSSSTGRRHPGATRIKFKGTAKFVSSGSSCHIGGAKVTLSTRLMLPQWTNRRKASRKMGLLWDTLSADIRRHEERHAEIARNHARALEKAILSLPSAHDCATLKAKVNAISEEAMTEHQKDQQRFDRVEAANFERRLIRLLKYRIESGKAG